MPTATVIGEFKDSALLKAFGREGDGVFAAPSVIEIEVERQYQVEVVGRTNAVREKFYTISIERKIQYPSMVLAKTQCRPFFLYRIPGREIYQFQSIEAV